MRGSLPDDEPVRLAALAGRRVALWGWGREARAAYRALRERDADQPLALFCSPGEADDARALGDAALRIKTAATADKLAGYEVVVKSPGISAYRPEAQAAAQSGTRFIGGTGLWFGERADAQGWVANALCVTGTKGKSTATALLAHLLRAGGHRTALVGNIGLPLLEALDPRPAPEFWAIELSSYQTRDVADSGARPQVAAVLNIFPEHLDWHGGHARYVEDKLALVTGAKPRVAVLNAADPILARLALPDSEIRWFNREDGWHLRGDALHRGDAFVFDATRVPLPGRHNRSNLCAALAAIEAIGLDAASLAAAAASFRPLPNRLQTLGERDGIVYVNDSISTTPHASLAALEVFGDRRVALLVGGHDRGLDWHDFAEALLRRPHKEVRALAQGPAGVAPAVIVTMGANGPRIHDLLQPLAGEGGFRLAAADDLPAAMAKAKALLGGKGVMLLSPGAPSFGEYRNYVARGRHFAELAGFDPELISAIPGIGIA